jgi:hypothetical protein
MGDLATVIESLVIDYVLAKSKILPQANKATQILLLIVGGCFFAGVLLLVYALYLWMLIVAGPPAAVASVGLVLVLFSSSVAYAFVSYRSKKLAKVKQQVSDAIQIASQLVKEDVGDAVQSNPKSVVAAACLAGFCVGKKFL